LESTTHNVSTNNFPDLLSIGIISYRILFLFFCVSHFSFSVDGIAIREFKNLESIGVPFPKNQPMRIYSSLWEADDWATCGGRVKTDWTKAPFVASFRNFNVNACAWSYGASSCKSKSGFANSISNSWIWEELDVGRKGQMKWVRDNYMTYDYCKDSKRFPLGLPRECYVTNFP